MELGIIRRNCNVETKRKDLTTGAVANLCGVAPRTVSKWFDSGQLRGYRIPGSQDRRIPPRYLIAFLRAHNMEIDPSLWEKVASNTVICFGVSDEIVQQLQMGMREVELECRVASSLLQLGAMLHQSSPRFIIADCDTCDVHTLHSEVMKFSEEDRPLLIFLYGQDQPSVSCFDKFRKPLDAELVVARIASAP